MRVTTAFNRTAPPARSVGRRRLLRRRGGDRDGPAAAPAARVLALRPDRPAARDPRPARQALAPPRPRRQPLRHRVRAAAAALPRLRRARWRRCRGRGRARATRATSRTSSRWLAQQMAKHADRRPAADRLGHRRADRRARRRRPPRRAPPRRAWSRIGVDEISYRRRQRYLTVGRRPPHAARSCGAPPGRNAATLAGASSTSSATASSRSGRSRSTCRGGYEKAIRDSAPRRRDLL